jgi:hypothetical protein
VRESAGPEVILQHTTIARVKVEPVSSPQEGDKDLGKGARVPQDVRAIRPRVRAAQKRDTVTSRERTWDHSLGRISMYRNSPPATPQRARDMPRAMLFAAMVIGMIASSPRPYDIGTASGAISPAPALAATALSDMVAGAVLNDRRITPVAAGRIRARSIAIVEAKRRRCNERGGRHSCRADDGELQKGCPLFDLLFVDGYAYPDYAFRGGC